MTAPPAPDPSTSAPRLVGARVTRREDRRLLRGLGDFIDDRRLHGFSTSPSAAPTSRTGG